jgi:hypothetical protein
MQPPANLGAQSPTMDSQAPAAKGSQAPATGSRTPATVEAQARMWSGDEDMNAHAIEVPADVAIYREAERALQLGDTALADELLAKLVVYHADSELADDALFERARLAYARGAWGAARASLDQLLEMKATPLREPARAMLCRIAERTGDRDARRCFDALHGEEKP